MLKPSPASENTPDRHTPFVLTETGASGLTVAAANDAAKNLGVRTGLSFTDARARVPQLQAEKINRKADVEALDRLAHWMIRFTPIIAIDGPDSLMLETTGCAHLHGGEAAMTKHIAALLEQNDIPHRMGLASTPGAAFTLARSAAGTILKAGDEASGLAGLPITTLRISAQSVQTLKRFGLTRIGQLYGIDRKSLARRFHSNETADQVLIRLDQALGLRPEPLDPLHPAPLKSARLACPEPISTGDAIKLGLAELITDLCSDLSAWAQGAREFVLYAFRADGSRDSISIRTTQPVRSAEHILRLFREHIEKIDPGFGIDLLLLEARRVDRMDISPATLSGAFVGNSADEPALSALADRIRVKLGEQAVWIGAHQESHIPEVAEQWMIFDGTFPDINPDRQKHGLRPIRIFDHPEPIQVVAEVPDGPPLHFVWRRISHRVVRTDGPERIGPEWWKHISIQPSAALPRTRDYYRVEDDNGRRYWLFRDGLYGDGRGGSPDWYIQGLFA